MYFPAETDSSNISVGAERIRRMRKRNKVLEELRAEQSKEALWAAVIAFQGYKFRTYSGLVFSYSLKKGRGRGNTESGVVTQDYGEALRWWRKAAEVGDLSGDAHYKIAECYIYGWGIGKNEYTASDWFLLSAGRGNLMAQIWLGRTALDEGRATEGVKWLKKAALQGSPIAQVQLGRAYMDGLDGVKQDNSEEHGWKTVRYGIFFH